MTLNMASDNHSQEERTQKLTQEDQARLDLPAVMDGENGGAGVPGKPSAPHDAHGDFGSGATVQQTAVIDPVGRRDDALAGFDIDSAGYPLNAPAANVGAYVADGFSEIPETKKHRGLKAFGITFGILVGLLCIVYIAGAVFFMGRMMPNTFVNDLDLSMKTDEEAAEMLSRVGTSYSVNVAGNGFVYQSTGENLGLVVETDKIIDTIHKDLNSWRWPWLMLMRSHDESQAMQISYNRDECSAAVTKAVKKFNKKAKAPVDATVTYDKKNKEYIVKPEEEGTQLNTETVVATALEGIDDLEKNVALSNDHLLKPKVYSTDEKLVESAKLANGMISAHLTLILNGQSVKEIDGSELSEFVKIDDDYGVKFDEESFDGWVRELVNGFDTIGTSRTFTREDGKVATVTGGVYGWEVDTAATKEAVLNAVKAGETTEIDIPCISTAAVFTGPGERDWGNRYIDVDISEQHVRFYGDNGKILWEADCISGTPDKKHDTFEGVWTVNNKESPSKLIGYLEDGKTKDYEVEVKYWIPFEGNGIGFHDATWQPSFGGDMYASGYGSHGCVNLSLDDAKKLYNMVQIGDVVVVHS